MSRGLLVVLLTSVMACAATGSADELAAREGESPTPPSDTGTPIDVTSAETGPATSDAATDATLPDGAPIFPPACVDELKNGAESDVDCGGGACPKCSAGKTCAAASDCDSGVCNDGKCALPSSCRALHAASPGLPTGAYDINPGSGSIKAYCDMTSDGGGWALAFKVDGAQSTWLHDNAVWTDTTTFGTNDASPAEAKLAAFGSLPFTELRVVMRDAGTDRAVVLRPEGLPAGATLRSVFASGTYYATGASRASWLGLVSSPSLQTLCNREGLNNSVGGQSLRLGIFGNQEADCSSCDSRLGIGYASTPASGNVASLEYDDSMAGGRNTSTFSFVWAR